MKCHIDLERFQREQTAVITKTTYCLSGRDAARPVLKRSKRVSESRGAESKVGYKIHQKVNVRRMDLRQNADDTNLSQGLSAAAHD